MTTETILHALRNATSPQARLAAWHSRPNYLKPRTWLARAAFLQGYGPELSAPEATRPLLWVTGEKDPEVSALYGAESLRMQNACTWYCDEWQDQTLETVAVILTRFPRLIFYGVRESMGDSIRIELSEWEKIDYTDCESELHADDARAETARGMIRRNDRATERGAEEVTAVFDGVENLKYQIEENREELKTLRAYIHQLARELRGEHGWMLANIYPIAAKACRDSLRRALANRRELMASNAALSASL